MTEDRFAELAPLAALGALDGPERAGFEAHLGSCAACRGELEAQLALVGRIPLALVPVSPSPGARRRVREAAKPATARRPGWLVPALAAAALVLGLSLLAARVERDAARREAASARESASGLEREMRNIREELTATRDALENEKALRDLVSHPESRLARLTGLPAAPKASARVVWNPRSREAVLVASGLDPAPEGKAYEVWVIAKGAPVPAGVFQADAEGKAVFRLPDVAETAEVRTFAVTLEPAGGTPAPTGPMVLAGAAS